MTFPIVGVLLTTYNDPSYLLYQCIRSIYDQTYHPLVIVCVDDGSEVPVKQLIDFDYNEERLMIHRIPHGERAVARETGLALLKEKQVDYFLFLDSDMKLAPGFIESAAAFASKNRCDGIVFPENSYSEAGNYWTKVKVFERNVYQVGKKVGRTSVEAARMWKMDRFPGFVSGLNAFEEIQPTLQCIRNGGTVRKMMENYIFHDEKIVTLKGLFKKKAGYFSEMSSHRGVQLSHLIQKFYFFRIQLYHPANLKRYLKQPHLFAGMVIMYVIHTLSAVASKLKERM